MDQETFEKETAMCRELNKKKGGCAWGKCETCGVIPLLHKLYKGEVLEEQKDIDEAKKKALG